MIRRIKGELVEKTPEYCVVMTGGVGYKIYVTKDASLKLPAEDETVSLYTYLMVKEDALNLYGFIEAEELAAFELALNVSGIGPRIALELFSNLSPRSFYLAVLNDDETKLAKTPGIGKKSAKRIILELKERIKGMELVEPDREKVSVKDVREEPGSEEKGADKMEEAKTALISLGYSEIEANRALIKVKSDITPEMQLEEILKRALKSLQRG